MLMTTADCGESVGAVLVVGELSEMTVDWAGVTSDSSDEK